MTDLAAMIAAAVSPGSIDHLGLLVHGDEGELKTGANGSNLVSPERVSTDVSLRTVLSDIGTYLSPTATVSFYSCSAAASERGTRLLVALSDLWPGRTVVGAVSKGYRFATLTAGNFSDTLLTVIENVKGTDQYFIPGQSTRPGRQQFFLPPVLPRFLSVAATVKKAQNGHIIQMPSGPNAYREFAARYPPMTRDMILAHPGQFVGGEPGAERGFGVVASDTAFYSTYLINIDWPANSGRDALVRAAGYAPGW
jgi:hypothetical protein